MTLPKFEGTPLFGRFPSFCVVNGMLLHQLGGARKTLNAGEEVNYKRHGTIKAVRILEKSAILKVTLPSGETSDVAVWHQSRTTIVSGQRHSRPLVPLVKDLPISKDGADKLGFVCPAWAEMHWDPAECTVLKCVDNTYAIVDHSVQCTIWVGRTADECYAWLA